MYNFRLKNYKLQKKKIQKNKTIYLKQKLYNYVAVACGPCKVDFKISGGSLNFQIIIRYFKYFYKKTKTFFLVLKKK